MWIFCEWYDSLYSHQSTFGFCIYLFEGVWMPISTHSPAIIPFVSDIKLFRKFIASLNIFIGAVV